MKSSKWFCLAVICRICVWIPLLHKHTLRTIIKFKVNWFKKETIIQFRKSPSFFLKLYINKNRKVELCLWDMCVVARQVKAWENRPFSKLELSQSLLCTWLWILVINVSGRHSYRFTILFWPQFEFPNHHWHTFKSNSDSGGKEDRITLNRIFY